MVKRCTWGLCNSDSRYPERLENGRVRFIPFPRPNRDREKCIRWIKLCNRPHGQITLERLVNNYTVYVCTKHFVDGAPSVRYPDPVPADKSARARLSRRPWTRRTAAVPPHKPSRIDDESLLGQGAPDGELYQGTQLQLEEQKAFAEGIQTQGAADGELNQETQLQLEEQEAFAEGLCKKGIGPVPGSMPTRLMPKISTVTPKTTRPEPNSKGSTSVCTQTERRPFCKHRAKKHPLPVKNKGPVTKSKKSRGKALISSMVPDTDAGSPNIFLNIIPNAGSFGMASSSLSCEQPLVAQHVYRLVPWEVFLNAIALPTVSNTSCLVPITLNETRNHSSIQSRHQMWTTTSDQNSAEFHSSAEMKQKVSYQEECPALSSQLGACVIEKEAAKEQPLPHCISHQETVKMKKTSCQEIILLQPKREPQSTGTSHFLKIENQTELMNVINPAFTKKEPEDFQTLWNTETVTQLVNTSFENKTKTEITKAGSEESPCVNNVTPVFIKKEPQDFNLLLSMAQTNSNSFEKRMGTQIYPTGIYHNVHFSHLQIISSDTAKDISQIGNASK